MSSLPFLVFDELEGFEIVEVLAVDADDCRFVNSSSSVVSNHDDLVAVAPVFDTSSTILEISDTSLSAEFCINSLH